MRPLSVEIMFPNQPLSSDRGYEVDCEAVGSRPPAKITWWMDGIELKSHSQKVRERRYIKLLNKVLARSPIKNLYLSISRAYCASCPPPRELHDAYVNCGRGTHTHTQTIICTTCAIALPLAQVRHARRERVGHARCAQPLYTN